MIRNIIKRLLFPNTYSSDRYIKYLKKIGMDIGENTYIWSPNHTYIDTQRPALIKIGKNSKISRGVIILAHDYSVSVVRRKYGQHLGQARMTVIGDNVFIGNNAIILMGAQVGSNSIVAAGAVVTKKFEDNLVIGGNPARVICTMDDYHSKHREKEVAEAIEYAKLLKYKYGQLPTVEDMGNAFAWLYLPRSTESVNKYRHFFKLSGDVEEEIIEDFLISKGVYSSFEEFLIKEKI